MANSKRVAPMFDGNDFFVEDGVIKVNGGGGGGYPPDNTKGLKLYGTKMGVKVDGETIVFDEDGNIKSEGGYLPDEDKGVELSSNKLAVKIDNDTVKFDSSGKLRVGNDVLEWKEYPAETLVNEKLTLPSTSWGVVKYNGIYYAPNSSRNYVAYCTDGRGLNWVNTPLQMSSNFDNIGNYSNFFEVTLDDGNHYLMASIDGNGVAVSGLRNILYSIGQLTDTGIVDKGYMQWAYSWSGSGWVNNIPSYFNPNTKEITFIINNSLTGTASSRYVEFYKCSGVSGIHTAKNSTTNSGTRIGEKSIGGSGGWSATWVHLADAWGYEFYADQLTNGSFPYLARRNSGSNACASYNILPSTNTRVACAYKNKLYLFSTSSGSTMREVSQDMTYVDIPMPYTGIVRAAYGDADNFYLCYSDGQIWRKNGTTWDRLHGTDSNTVFSKVGVFSDGEIYGINTSTKKLWTIGTATIHRLEQNNIDVTTDFITWLRWELQKNIY